MMDTLIKQDLNHAIWNDANIAWLITLHILQIITDNIMANNTTIMKWDAAWCQLAKVKPSKTLKAINVEKPPAP